MATVELKGVSKRFGAVEVIHSVDLSIREGEFLVLVGPSGCGKSTLLRMISGLETISSGDLFIGGKRVNDVPARDRGISMVFQSYALYPHMTSAQNMSFALKLAGKSPDEQAERIKPAAGVLGLGDYLDRFPRELSGGQRQRVAMGRAIVREPEVFLFDEPLSNLDAKLRVRMRAELKELHQKLKTTTVYVTHDQIEAMTLADRIVVLRDGVIEQVGAPLELYDNPANRFVGSFLGSPAMNFFELSIPDGTPDRARFADGDSLQLPRELGGRSSVTVGVRPESLELVSEAGDGTISAEVAVIEPTGSETELFLRKGKDQIIASFRDRIDVRPGEIVHLEANPAKYHLFDTTTELAI
ncbi:ABC transporter ATP-binding protein [Tropicimonas sediminicola]|uniref:Carbohydrate ABC transporter ATP-binding protein, CUT1 family n=1 Tax=Tropicimonas sediminicola TaxID=1031541 RepID=A0A239LLW6_9RHOB|nr:sn-glycerol-3-phosphate ABC transporter ATP-binding protein UgpC [Tropicimonas sediminicola]SNT30564.1 carbohydrate ABC transporter ATP-binding protein, CUT1 family [Tropicimonas sediminicola]